MLAAHAGAGIFMNCGQIRAISMSNKAQKNRLHEVACFFAVKKLLCESLFKAVEFVSQRLWELVAELLVELLYALCLF